jgi:hypothetical protein
MSLADSLAWQTLLPDAITDIDNTSLLNQTHVLYQSGIGVSIIQKSTETQTSIQLDSR